VYLGAHIGIADGLAEAPVTGRRIGCDAIQIFSKSPQMWAGAPLSDDAARAFADAVRAQGLKATAIHHGYLANMGSPKKAGLARSRRAFQEELERAERIGVDALILHPGAHLADGVDGGIARIAEGLNRGFAAAPGGRVRVLLENAAGQGSTLGRTFSELARILELVEDRSRIGVALDTCHLFGAGYDFRTEESYGRLVDQLESELGAKEVHAFHLNDSKAELGSHIDRHENIGKGKIGLEGFRGFVNDPRWAEVPGYLETPLDDDDYASYVRDLSSLRSLLGPARREPASTRAPRRRAPSSGT
jgi:deoxyribonuclease-4